jgi:hypothetical protein
MESDCKKLLFDHIPSEMAYRPERGGPLKAHLRRIKPHLPAGGDAGPPVTSDSDRRRQVAQVQQIASLAAAVDQALDTVPAVRRLFAVNI